MGPFDVISIHSRKGGVGKTSLGWSLAFQLAATGHKTAFLDLDTLGTHSSQSLPLSRYTRVVQEGERQGKYKLVSESDSDTSEAEPGFGPNLPFWNWMFRTPGNRRTPPTLDQCKDSLVVSSKVQSAADEKGIGSELQNVVHNLSILACSPYLRDADPINQAVIAPDTARRYKQVLTRIAHQLREDNYRFLIIDNTPGLAYAPGVNLNWVFDFYEQTSNDAPPPTIHAWFMGNAAWWEHALILYELNTVRDDLARISPAIIVNRVIGRWGGLEPGTIGTLDSQTTDWNQLNAKFLELPIYKSLDLETSQLVGTFLLPDSLPVAPLRFDGQIRNATQGGTDKFRETNKNAGWPEWCESVLLHFTIAALLTAKNDKTFHRDINQILVKDILLPNLGQ